MSFVDYFTARRYGFVGNVVFSCAFWAVEVLGLAMGLLWLTSRTFERCFDRIPERPPRNSLLSVVVTILAAMTAAGSLSAAVESWVVGIEPGTTSWPVAAGNSWLRTRDRDRDGAAGCGLCNISTRKTGDGSRDARGF